MDKQREADQNIRKSVKRLRGHTGALEEEAQHLVTETFTYCIELLSELVKMPGVRLEYVPDVLKNHRDRFFQKDSPDTNQAASPPRTLEGGR